MGAGSSKMAGFFADGMVLRRWEVLRKWGLPKWTGESSMFGSENRRTTILGNPHSSFVAENRETPPSSFFEAENRKTHPDTKIEAPQSSIV